MAKKNTPDLAQQITDAARKILDSNIPDNSRIADLNQEGVAKLLSVIFQRESGETRDIFLGDDLINDGTNIAPIVYGTVWLDISSASKVLVRSSTDPGRILERYVFPMADGENGGIVGDTEEEKLSNILINDTPILDPDSGLANFADFVFKQIVGDGNGSTWSGEPNTGSVGENDPITGERIAKLDAPAKDIKFEELTDVDHTSQCNYSIPYFDADSCTWKTKHINDLIIEVNPDLEK